MAVVSVALGGEWFCPRPGALTDISRSALRSASMTGKVGVVHRHARGVECEDMVSGPDDPHGPFCFWVWPDQDWAGGNRKLEVAFSETGVVDPYSLPLSIAEGYEPAHSTSRSYNEGRTADLPQELLTDDEKWAMRRTGNSGG